MAVHVLAGLGLCLVLAGWSLAFYCFGHDLRLSLPALLRQPLLGGNHSAPSAAPPLPSVLMLGPSGAGKSTLFHAALKLAGEDAGEAAATATAPTRGLVRRVLRMPSSNRHQEVVLCDAGGQRQQRRQWVELVRAPALVGALVFVADVSDGSNDTLELFRQLANAKWASRATLLLALSHVDKCDGTPDEVRAACERRVAEYRAACHHPFGVHRLCCFDGDASRSLLTEAVDGARVAAAAAASSRQHDVLL